MLICVLGLPGSGKSTLSKRLLERLQTPPEENETPSAGQKSSSKQRKAVAYLHPGRYAASMGWVPRYASRAQLAQVPQLNERFMEALGAALDAGDVITDGFPRTEEQARLLLAAGWKVTVVHLVFPAGREVELSIARQEKRIKDDGVVVPRSEVEEQTSFAMKVDQAAADLMLQSGCRVLTIDALLSESEVEALVLGQL